MKNGEEIKVTVFRFNPAKEKEGQNHTYAVSLVKGMSVLNVLQYINENYDGGLAYYISCRRGACAGCTVKVNGKARLACTEIVKGDLTIEPVSKDKVIKDLLMQSTRKEA